VCDRSRRGSLPRVVGGALPRAPSARLTRWAASLDVRATLALDCWAFFRRGPFVRCGCSRRRGRLLACAARVSCVVARVVGVRSCFGLSSWPWVGPARRSGRASGRPRMPKRLQALVSVVFMACLAARGRTSRVGSPCAPCPNSKANSVALDWDGGPLASAVRCTAVGAVRLSMSIVAWCLWAVVFARYRDLSGRQVRHLLSLFSIIFLSLRFLRILSFIRLVGNPTPA
jgi:hypothetical protein